MLMLIIRLATIINIFSLISLTTLNPKMELGILNRFEFKVQFLAIATKVIWAYFQGTIWALFGVSLLNNIFKLIESYLLEVGSLRCFAWKK